MTVIGVRFRKAGKIYYFDPDGLDIKKDDNVIVETIRGIEFGTVEYANKEINSREINIPLKKVIRLANDQDKAQSKKNKEREKEAVGICNEKIAKHRLGMKLVDVEITFDMSKIIFYFTADGRVDFRELVKDLAAVFRTRIELRQIGVRDEAKLMNGIGICGRTLCCGTFLSDFHPVSIKMAKDQGLSLNPSKISGICGRLMCCLKYEQDNYEELLKNMPHEGDIVETPEGDGEVMSINVLKQIIKVSVKKPPRNDVQVFFFSPDEIKILRKKRRRDDYMQNESLKELLD